MDIVLLALATYLVIITVGQVAHKYTRLPWMFTVVVFGMLRPGSELALGQTA